MKKIIYVDIDETICTGGLKYDYTLAKPIQENIDKINKLYDEGNIIYYWTARGSTTGFNWRPTTEKQLSDWGVKYHQLRMNKPGYDILIDDKSKRIEEIQ